MKKSLLCISLVIFGVSACDYQFRDKPVQNENSANVGVKANQNSSETNSKATNSNAVNSSASDQSNNTNEGGKLVFDATAENKTIPCNGAEVDITAEATANTYNFTGECEKLTVSGVSNKVTVEKVGEINVGGISNKVAYGEGLDGKKPKIKINGTSAIVDSMKAIAEKKAAVEK